MTEQNETAEAATPGGMPEREIEFEGRQIWVRVPRPEQLLVWKRTLATLQKAESGSWDGEQAMNALDRAFKVISSLLINKVDEQWLEDQLLEGNLDLIKVAGLIQLATEAFQADGNREERRAAKKTPAKKAARKKAGTR